MGKDSPVYQLTMEKENPVLTMEKENPVLTMEKENPVTTDY